MESSRDGLRRRSGGGRAAGLAAHLLSLVDLAADLARHATRHGAGFHVSDRFDADGFESLARDALQVEGREWAETTRDSGRHAEAARVRSVRDRTHVASRAAGRVAAIAGVLHAATGDVHHVSQTRVTFRHGVLKVN